MQISEKLIQMSARGDIAPMSSKDALAIEAALSAAEPVAWQPRYKQEVIDHHKSIGSDLWEYAMTVYPTKEQAQGYGYGGHECRALYAAPPAPSVAVKDWSAEIKKLREYRRLAYNTGFLYLADWMEEMAAALSAQVQDVAGWQDISTLEPKDGMIVMGWGEYRERDGFSPAFMRWYDSVGGWNVNAMPFYPTHWRPLPTPPSSTRTSASSAEAGGSAISTNGGNHGS